ncbi:MAG: M48 family metallopeptidase, partial [Microgenomates group bacterium]
YMGDSSFYLGFGLIFSLISSVGSYFYSDKIVLAMSGAKLADKKTYFDYYTVTQNMAIAAGVPMPRVFVIEDDAMNAFATGRDPQHAVVVATTGILSKLNRTELEGVIAHELSHVKNYDIRLMAIVAVLVGTVVFVADWITRSFMWGGIRDSDDDSATGKASFILFIIFLFITPIIATLIQLAVSRRREYLADASGALLNRNPDALADALLKISGDSKILSKASNATAHLFIENPFKKDVKKTSFVADLFSTHPPVDERIRLLREM